MRSGERGRPRDADEPERLDLYLSKAAIEEIRAQGRGEMSSFVESLLFSDKYVKDYGVEDLPKLAGHNPRLVAQVLVMAKHCAESEPDILESRPVLPN